MDEPAREMVGRVVGIRGSVIDLEFPRRLPRINEAVHIDAPSGRITVEVQLHLSRTRVRGIAMSFTAGLARNAEALATGRPISVPVGDAVLGRMIDVIGARVGWLVPSGS